MYTNFRNVPTISLQHFSKVLMIYGKIIDFFGLLSKKKILEVNMMMLKIDMTKNIIYI